ncbi:MAG: hypothetical protein ACI9YT_000222 [Halobacteriales archaeon]|jgi:hypothetical protein
MAMGIVGGWFVERSILETRGIRFESACTSRGTRSSSRSVRVRTSPPIKGSIMRGKS